MAKKIIALLMILMLVMSFTGCMQITYHITLNSNGTADAEYEMYMDKSTVSMIMGSDGETSDPFAENRANAEAKGFTVTPIETENQIGFKATAENTELNIQEIVQNVGMGGNGEGGITVKKGLFTNTYTVNANIDTKNIFGEDEQSQSMLPLLNNSISVKLLFTAPSEIISETGTVVENMPNTREYKIEMGKDNQISFTYTLVNMTNIYIFIGIILIVILLILFRLRSKKKKSASENEIIIEDGAFGDGAPIEISEPEESNDETEE